MATTATAITAPTEVAKLPQPGHFICGNNQRTIRHVVVAAAANITANNIGATMTTVVELAEIVEGAHFDWGKVNNLIRPAFRYDIVHSKLQPTA
ncbi:hypothetical protein N7528_009254 [Penicillium herquei]|nr:hypothetical protein N7528_009254 [Penicillium herquei]